MAVLARQAFTGGTHFQCSRPEINAQYPRNLLASKMRGATGNQRIKQGRKLHCDSGFSRDVLGQGAGYNSRQCASLELLP
jgi:hypothetical protein